MRAGPTLRFSCHLQTSHLSVHLNETIFNLLILMYNLYSPVLTFSAVSFLEWQRLVGGRFWTVCVLLGFHPRLWRVWYDDDGSRVDFSGWSVQK